MKYKIEGIVVNMSTSTGIPNLVVVAIDIDFTILQQSSSVKTSNSTKKIEQHLMYDRLGSVLTDSGGRFMLEFEEDDFISKDADKRPDIMLVVLAPEISSNNPFDAKFYNALSLGTNIMHVSPPIRLKAGKIESYSIRITSEVLTKFQMEPLGKPSSPDPDTVAKNIKNKRNYAQQILSLRVADVNARLQDNETLIKATDSLFSKFSLSKVSKEIKEKDTYYAPGNNLLTLQDNIINNKLSLFDNPDVNTSFKLKLPAEVIALLGLVDSSGNLIPNLGSEVLWNWWNRKNDTILERRRNAYERCIQPFREEGLSPETPEDSPPEDTDTDSTGSPDITLDEKINKLVDCSACPEEPLRFSKIIDPDYKEVDLKKTIKGIELTGGPTDVTSYHDFDVAQIAFETIWTEVFDESLENLGKDIYAEIVRTADDTCADRLIRAHRLNVNDPSSLKSLLKEYRSITGARRNTRLDNLFTQLEERLAEPYKFDVFAPNSYNYGVIFTYRQKWEPQPYQVGPLVKTIPLAPKEVRKYKTKVTKKLSKTQKELEDREFKGSSESSSTSRAESEIVSRAINKTSFSTNTQGQIDMQMYNMQFGMNTGMESEKFSESTKKNFRESVLKAAQEYRKQTKLEVETSSEDQYESVSSGEISNPNEEISVSYLFYELQRQYYISEQLHRITPFICVAFEVPKPHEIDNDWLMTYGWIIRRVLLDEDFHAALDYLMNSSVGSEIALQEMGSALQSQKKLVQELNKELEIKNKHVDDIMNRIVGLMTGDATIDTITSTADFIHGLINPMAGLFGGGSSDSAPDLEKYKEIMQMQLERSEKEQKRLEGRLREAQSDLQAIADKFGKMSRNHFDQQTAIAQLRIHVKENILYYMQAIWDYEPKDQRYFRLYDLEVEWFEDPGTPISTGGLVPRLNPETGEIEWVEGEISLPMGGVRRSTRKLVDIADIDNLLGFKGNYAIFPVKEPNYIHLYMMKDFIDTQTGGLKDPDEFAGLSTQGLIDYLKCIRTNEPSVYEAEKDSIIGLINERQRSPRRERELVVVPSDSLYIECLPGKHAVLEDFKLAHRAIDVKRVQAKVRKLELENLRYAKRLINDNLSDPEIDKNINIDGSADLDIES